MSSLLWTAVGLVSVIVLFLLSLLVPLLQKDLEEGLPWLAEWLVRRAAHTLPAEHQARFEEEWLAELSAVPGVMVFKLRFALMVSLQAGLMTRALKAHSKSSVHRETSLNAADADLNAPGTQITFYDVKTRRSVKVPLKDVAKTKYERTTSWGSTQFRYALRGNFEGRNLTKFVGQADFEAADLPIV